MTTNSPLNAPPTPLTSTLSVNAPMRLMHPIRFPDRLMLGPGPSNMSGKAVEIDLTSDIFYDFKCLDPIREALSAPLLGHLHPEFLEVCIEVRKRKLGYFFRYFMELHSNACRGISMKKQFNKIQEQRKICYFQDKAIAIY